MQPDGGRQWPGHQSNPYLPAEAEVVENIDETRNVFTLRLRLTDPELHRSYDFAPGQFNMLYLYGVGEVAISIVSDPEDGGTLDHTIRAVGRATKRMARLRKGDRIGIRGPYGRGWPLDLAEKRDVLLVTGGLGCAPLVSVINYIVRRRDRYRRLCIVQGVKHAADLIWRDRYAGWAELPNTRVLLAADRPSAGWKWHVGLVTELLQDADVAPDNSLTMICGPEPMMAAAAKALTARAFPRESLFMSMERNMHCAVRHCGHCQIGPDFVCRDGPIFPYSRMQALLEVQGF